MDYNLHQLAEQGEFATLETILRGISASERKSTALNELDNAGWSPLHYAIHKGHLKVALLLLKHGTDPNLSEKDGTPILVFTIQSPLNLSNEQIAELAQWLIESGADPMKCTASKDIALHTTIRWGNFHAAYTLLNHANITPTIRERQITWKNNRDVAVLNIVLERFIEKTYQPLTNKHLENKQFLYPILLSGVSIKPLLPTLPFNIEQRGAIIQWITETEDFIAQAKKECDSSGQDAIYHYIFSAKQEKKTLNQESLQAQTDVQSSEVNLDESDTSSPKPARRGFSSYLKKLF